MIQHAHRRALVAALVAGMFSTFDLIRAADKAQNKNK